MEVPGSPQLYLMSRSDGMSAGATRVEHEVSETFAGYGVVFYLEK